MREPGQRHVGDLAAHVEVHDLSALAVAGGADHVCVRRVEEEIVEDAVELRAPRRERPRDGDALLAAVVVDVALVDRFGAIVVRELPQFRNVLQRGHEALARRRVVHGRHARGATRRVADVDDPDRIERAGVERDERVRQVIAGHHEASVAGHCDVARVDADPDLGDERERPEVVLRDPAVARREEHVAAVGRELRPAVQRVPRGEAHERFETIAVEDRHVMIAGLDDDEEVQRIAVERGARRRLLRVRDLRCADFVQPPARRLGQRRVDVVGERLDGLRREAVGEARHLRRGAALRDDLRGVGALQAFEILRQQGRAHRAEAVGAVARRAELLVVGGRFGARGRCPREDGEQRDDAERGGECVTHGSSPRRRGGKASSARAARHR